MRIGELLLDQKRLRQGELARSLEEQRGTNRRLVSLLIKSGVLDFDEGARALGDQKGVPCVLAKHLAARDPALARLVPPELARTWCALPIGRASSGALVVCARDPHPRLAEALAQTTKSQIVLVIAPASRIESLVAQEYGPTPNDEFDVMIDSQVELPPAERPTPPSPLTPPLPDMDALDPKSVRLALTDLDDDRVAKDPTQSGQLPILGKPTRVDIQRTSLPPTPQTLAATRAALDQATSREAATDAAIAFFAGRWISGVVCAIRDNVAIGYRGQGASLGDIASIEIPLSAPSTLLRAVETKKTSIQIVNGGPAQSVLVERLGTRSPSASPVLVAGRVVAVIVVGDAIHRAGDTERSIAELGQVAQLLGATYERLRGSR